MKLNPTPCVPSNPWHNAKELCERIAEILEAWESHIYIKNGHVHYSNVFCWISILVHLEKENATIEVEDERIVIYPEDGNGIKFGDVVDAITIRVALKWIEKPK